MPEPKEVKFIAFAAFDFGGKHYEPGKTFVPPATLKRDADFDEFRQTAKRRGAGTEPGIAFLETLPPLTPKGDPIQRRTILPLKEA